MLELNTCSQMIRDSQLERQALFAFLLVGWASEGLTLPRDHHKVERLRDPEARRRDLYSAPLKESLADARIRIADLAALQRQKREEAR